MTTSAPPSRRIQGSRFARRAGGAPARRRRPGGPFLTLALCLGLVAMTACASGGGAPAVVQDSSPGAQMEFGVQMAQRGLWNEALFRFQRAQRLSPGDPEVLNNLAVALEATGQFDDALDAYQRALEASPENRELRRNYARFVEFYQSYRPQETEGEGSTQEASGGAGEAADGGASLARTFPSLQD